MIVVDANILIRAILGRRVRQLIETYGARGVRFFAPESAFEEAGKYLPILLKKYGKPVAGFSASLQYLREIIHVLDSELYLAFETDARERLRGRDEDDWPVLAKCAWSCMWDLERRCGLLWDGCSCLDNRPYRDFSEIAM